MVRGRPSVTGFTLVEVLIAMAITALISMVAYTGLSSALSGAESLRSASGRAHEINQPLHCCHAISVRWSTAPLSTSLVRWCQRSWVVRWHGNR